MTVLGLGSNKVYSGESQARGRAQSGAPYLKKWKPIDARKFGYDVSVRPTDRPPVQTQGVGVKILVG